MVGIERESKFDPDTDGKENTQEVFDKISIFDTSERSFITYICIKARGWRVKHVRYDVCVESCRYPDCKTRQQR